MKKSLYDVSKIDPKNAKIGRFHVTQISLIITQVKNKIAYLSLN